jgi:hypothetical protein
MASTPPSSASSLALANCTPKRQSPKLVDFKTECSCQKLSVAVNFESFRLLRAVSMVKKSNQQLSPSLGLIVDRRANGYDHLNDHRNP